MVGRIRFYPLADEHKNHSSKKNGLPTIITMPYPGTAVLMVNHDTHQSSLHYVSGSSSNQNNAVVVWQVDVSYNSTSFPQTTTSISNLMKQPIFHYYPSKKLAIVYGSHHPSLMEEEEDCTCTIYQWNHNIPSPLHSIQVVMTKKKKQKEMSHLEQGYIKRYWIGSLVLLHTTSIEQQIPIPTSYPHKLPIIPSSSSNQNNNHFVTVTSCQPKQNNTNSSTIGIIVPSTIITIHTNNSDDAIMEEETKNDVVVEMNETMKFMYDMCDMFFHYKDDNNELMPQSILLTGPPGVGKTFAVKTVYTQLRIKYPSLHLTVISGNDTSTTITSGGSGIVFFDEVDALCINSMGCSYLSQWFHTTTNNTNTIIIAATNHVESIPHSLRRRFDYPHYYVSPPNSSQRLSILKSLLPSSNHTITTDNHKFMRKEEDEEEEEDLLYINHRQTKTKDNKNVLSESSLEEISKDCVGYVAADLAALVRTSMTRQISLREAMSTMRPSALRAVMEVTKSEEEKIVGDVGGAKVALQQAMKWPRLKPRQFAHLQLSPPKGILLYGPPGCAKTSLAKAAAQTSGYAFYSLNPAEVLATSFVGDAEATIRRAFASARQSSPCILFIDEIDAILGTGGTIERNGSSNSRILSTFLNEMDGITTDNNSSVLVLGATNRPQTLDAALLRPGRLDQLLYVPPPNQEARRIILESFFLFASDEMVQLSNDMTGAELVGCCRHAILTFLQQQPPQPQPQPDVTTTIPFHHIQTAFQSIQPLLRTNPSILDQYIQFGKTK